MQIEHVWIILAGILVLAHIWALTRVLRNNSRVENKGVWIVVLAAVPLLGLLLWLFMGPKAVEHRLDED